MCTELNKIVEFITYKNEKLNNIYQKKLLKHYRSSIYFYNASVYN